MASQKMSQILCLYICLLTCGKCFGEDEDLFEVRFTNMEQDIDMLKSTIELFAEENSYLKVKADNYEKEIGHLKSQIQHIETMETPARRILRNGFTAWKNGIQTYELGDVIIFENVLSNDGGYYDTTTGYFTCPEEGFYFVNASLQRDGFTSLLVEVVYEGVRILAISDTDPDHDDSTASVSGLFNCNTGNRIYIRASGTGSVYGGDPTSFFTVIGL